MDIFSWKRCPRSSSARRSRHFASPWVRLLVEQLEDKRLMTADDPAETVVAGAQTARGTEHATASLTALPERFESAAELEQWLLDAAVEQWGHLFGQSTYDYPRYWGGQILFGDIAFRAMDTPVAVNLANDFSDTNVQVAGVDEADLVETDGEYLYILSGQDLVIVEAGIGEDLRVVSRTRLPERPQGMYLSGDRLALVSTSQPVYGPIDTIRVLPVAVFAAQTDGQGPSDDEAAGPTTTVTVLDISDRAAPSVVHTTDMDGQLVTSRVVDGQLRLVMSNYLNLPMPIAHPVDTTALAEERVDLDATPVETATFLTADRLWWPGPSGPEKVYETKEQYVARVRDQLLALVQPQTRSKSLEGEVLSETPLFAATELHRPDSLSERNVITVATFDLASNAAGPAATANVMADQAPQVYATADSVYVFAQQTQDWTTWDSTSVYKSDVWKFAIDGETHAVELTAVGEFEGSVLNQFAADERDGYLRLVTKPASWSGGHSVHVLEQTGDTLSVVGSIGGVAPNEELYSVRFMDERAFFVTFRKVDPLFAVDLSDPGNPQLLGELHIPGYSDYLQPIDESHLLAIGRGADEQTGFFEELQVSVFDVSDLTDPQLLHRYSFGGGRSTATPATGNRWTRGDGDHHAVSYFAEEQIFALPILTDPNDGWAGPENTPLFEPGEGGLQVFKVDLDDGFSPMGLVEHDTLIERSVRIGEHLFAISTGTVSVHDLADPETQLGEVEIAAEPDEEPLELKKFEPTITQLPDGDPADDDKNILTTEDETPVVDAQDDHYTVNAFAGTQFLAVRDNDTNIDPPGELRVIAVSSTALGANAAIDPDGLGILYSPDGTFGAQDTFTYTVSDNDGNEATATVTIDLVNERVQTTVFSRQLVVPGEISTTTLRWHDPDPNVSFSATLTWADNTPASMHMTQSFNGGTEATVSFWRTPTTFGEFTGTLTVRNSGGFEASYLVTINAVTVILRPDEQDSTKTELAIGGFDLGDPILFQPDVGGKQMVSPGVIETVADEPSVRLSYHGSDMGTFIADRIVVYGQGGNDLIQVNQAITIDAWLFGGAGNDILVGGGGNDILVGGIGDDILYGFGGRDLVFGGLGADFVHGGGWSGPLSGDDSDIVIGDYVSFDFDPALLRSLSQRWQASDTYLARIASIRAEDPKLIKGQTVFDDWSPDSVFGAADMDWLFGEVARDVFDTQPGEMVNSPVIEPFAT